MTRGYWAWVMLFSLAVSSGAGWYLYTEFQQKSSIEVPLKKDTAVAKSVVPVQPTAAPAAVSSNTIASTVPGIAAPEKPEKKIFEPIKKAAVKHAAKKKGKIKVDFAYQDENAKRVYFVSDFNHWYRKPLVKKQGVWTISFDLKPGIYEYKFVVDNRRIKDPNNPETRNGNSLLTVTADPSH